MVVYRLRKSGHTIGGRIALDASLREDKLLWVEDNGKLIRAEWDVGPRGRIQAYFDPGKGDMPVYCRIIIPINKEEKFGKKTRLAFNEIETEWAQHLDGWFR